MSGGARALIAASVAFTVGVIFGPAAHPGRMLAVTALLLLLAAGAARRRRRAAGFFLGTAFFFAGVLTPALRFTPATVAPSAGVLIEGLVVEAPEIGERADALIVDVTATATAPGAKLVPGAARVRLRVASPVSPPAAPCARAGDRIRAWAAPLRAPAPSTLPTLRSRRLAVRRGVTLEGEAAGCAVVVPAAGVAALGAWLRARVAAACGPGLVAVLATGERTGIDPAVEQRLHDAGLAHLLVAHNLYWLGLVFLLARWKKGVALPAIAGFTLLHGADPSAVRTAITAALLVAALHRKRGVTGVPSSVASGRTARQRGRDAAGGATEAGLPTAGTGDPEAADPAPLVGLALAAVVILAIVPEALGDVAFQLTFAAMAAMVRIEPALGRLRAARVLAAGLAATIGMTPLVARIFDRVGIGGLVAHVAILPWASLVAAPLATLGGVLGALHPSIGAPVLWLAARAAALIPWLAEPVQGALRIPTPTVLECLLFYLATGFFCAREKRMAIAGLVCVLGIAASVAHGLRARPPAGALEVAVLPTSGGISLVANLRDGRVLAIDGGAPPAGFALAERRVAGYLGVQRRTHLDVLCVLEPERAETARILAAQLEVREVWWNGPPASVPAWFGRTPDRFLDGTLDLGDGLAVTTTGVMSGAELVAPASPDRVVKLDRP